MEKITRQKVQTHVGTYFYNKFVPFSSYAKKEHNMLGNKKVTRLNVLFLSVKRENFLLIDRGQSKMVLLHFVH